MALPSGNRARADGESGAWVHLFFHLGDSGFTTVRDKPRLRTAGNLRR